MHEHEKFIQVVLKRHHIINHSHINIFWPHELKGNQSNDKPEVVFLSEGYDGYLNTASTKRTALNPYSSVDGLHQQSDQDNSYFIDNLTMKEKREMTEREIMSH